MINETTGWAAVLAHDAAADGKFVYGVRSTGIYCRPSCPSRRPGRAQIVFFPVPEAAEQAGFRACRRCRPGGVPAADPQAEIVRAACRYIDAHLDGPLTLTGIGAAVALSPGHLQRTFKRVLGITPRQYADARRLGRVKAGLREGAAIGAALYDAGYGSSSRLYERAPAQLGMTPAAYRRGGAGMRIRYTLASSALGRLLVAATERGICMISLGDSDAPLEAALAAEYPAASITRDESALGDWVGAVLRHLDGTQPCLDLPLDLQATAFRWQVWEALRAIPYGETRTYGQIAAALGRKGAARAVGSACAGNPVSLVIPCHRAVGSDGSLTGYRWGVERKRALLDREATPG